MKIKILFASLIAVLVVIPSSASTGFIYEPFTISSFPFSGSWQSPTPGLFVAEDGYLMMPQTGLEFEESYISHDGSFTSNNLAVMRIRIGADTSDPDYAPVRFRLCAQADILLPDESGYRPMTGICETWTMTYNPYFELTISARTTSPTVILQLSSQNGDITGKRGKVDYIDYQCIALCSGIAPPTPTPSRTPIIYPTGVPRTNTPFPTGIATPTPRSIDLTPPANGGGTGDADCGVYECGSVDLSFPVLPPLESPTAITISQNPGNSTLVALVTPVTGNPAPPTPLVNNDANLDDYIAGNGNIRPNDPNTGQPIEVDMESVLAPNNNLFIAYAKGLYGVNEDYFGSFAPIVSIFLTTMTILMFITGARFILPIAVILIGLARKAWGAFMDLVPF